jgi:hypothetical protein
LLRGDIDGDGSTDRVFVSVARQAASRCRYLLVVALDGKRLAAAIEHRWYPRAPRSFVKRYLQLDSLIALTPRGLDVVVKVDRGATTNSVAIFSAEGGTLRRRSIREPGSEHLFIWGGSVTHHNAIDCKGRRARLLVETGGGLVGRTWTVERTVFRASPAGALEVVRTKRYSVRDQRTAARRFPEFAGGGTAFRSCTVVKRS